MKKTLLAELQFRAKNDARVIAVALSVILSCWLIWRGGIINNDGILYLQSAEAFVQNDWRRAVQIYPWPFYSWLISLAHQSFGLSLESAAYLINIVLYAALTGVFITLVRELDPRPVVSWLAAVVILLLPSLNDYRVYIIRDAGYWACYLAALLYLFRYMSQQRLSAALAWGGSIALATLFRIEGVGLMVLLPLTVFFDSGTPLAARYKRFVVLNIVLLLCAVGVAAYFLVNAGTPAFAGRLTEPFTELKHLVVNLGTTIPLKAEALRAAVLNEYSKDFALGGLMAVLLTIVIGKILSSLGVVHLLLSGYGVAKRKLFFEPPVVRVIAWTVVVQVLIIAVFTINHFFLTGRHVIGLVLALLLFAPTALAEIFSRWKGRREQSTSRVTKWLFPLVCVLSAGTAVDIVHSSGPSKRYIKEGGEWIAVNTPPSSSLLTNDKVLAYYAKRKMKQNSDQFNEAYVVAVLNGGEVRFDYVALNVKRGNLGSLTGLERLGEPVARFGNNRKDELLIFKYE